MKREKAEILFDAITAVREDLIEAAQNYVFHKKPSAWRRYAALAACLVVVAGLGFGALPCRLVWSVGIMTGRAAIHACAGRNGLAGMQAPGQLLFHVSVTGEAGGRIKGGGPFLEDAVREGVFLRGHGLVADRAAQVGVRGTRKALFVDKPGCGPGLILSLGLDRSGQGQTGKHKEKTCQDSQAGRVRKNVSLRSHILSRQSVCFRRRAFVPAAKVQRCPSQSVVYGCCV